MPSNRRRRRHQSKLQQGNSEGWVRVPNFVNANGDKMVTLVDNLGQPRTRLVAEIMLETWVGPRPAGHIVRFKDGNRLNCAPANLDWVPAESSGPDEVARA
jgi:hypothetical protein